MATEPFELPQAAGEPVDIRPVVEALRPAIKEASAFMEAEHTMPGELLNALEAAGIFRTLLPPRLGGLGLRAGDHLDLVHELARIDASVAWIAVVQSGLRPLLAADIMDALLERSGGRWIVADGISEDARAVRLRGGYRFTGTWSLATGAAWATHFAARAPVVDEAGAPVLDARTGAPATIDGVFARDEVALQQGPRYLGLNGTATGRFTVRDAELDERRATGDGPPPGYTDSPLLHLPRLGLGALFLGTARGALDAVLALTKRKALANSISQRWSGLAHEQMHRVDIGTIEASLRSARAWDADIHERFVASVPDGDASEVYDLRIQQLQSEANAGQVAKRAMRLIHDFAGSDSVMRDRGIERRLRDLYTATQRAGAVRASMELYGRYFVAKELGGPLDMPVIPHVLPAAPAPRSA